MSFDEFDNSSDTLFLFHFGEVSLDEAKSELWIGNTPVHAQPIHFKILQHILRNHERNIGRAEIRKVAWGSGDVSDASIDKAVSTLRSTLGANNCIKTIPRLGYRFTGEAPQRTAIARSKRSALSLTRGQSVPGRSDFLLTKVIGATPRNEVWTARHVREDVTHVFKFCRDDTQLTHLKREELVSRLLRDALGDRDDLVRIIAANFDKPNFYIESEFGGANLAEWGETNSNLLVITRADRLALFLRILAPIVAAHSVRITHADLKPENILVHGEPNNWHIRLCDFENAQWLPAGERSGVKLNFASAAIMQSLSYNSAAGPNLYVAPELRKPGARPTPQSDIYALGIILFQIVAGDFGLYPTTGWERYIGDDLLEGVIRKAANVNLDEREQTVSGLVEVIESLERRRAERAQQQEYEIRLHKAREATKFAEARRRQTLILTVVFGLGFAISTILAFLFYRIYHDRAIALDTSKRLERFLIEDFIGAANPAITGRNNLTVVEAAKSAADKIDARITSSSPEVEAELHRAMAETLFELGEYQAALDQGDKALEAYRKLRLSDRKRLATIQLGRAEALKELSQPDKADDVLTEAEKLAGGTPPTAELEIRLLTTRATILMSHSKVNDAIVAMEKALELVRRNPDVPPVVRNEANFVLADSYRLGRRYADAESTLRTLIGRETSTYGDMDARPLYAKVALGSVLSHEERDDEAIELLKDTVPKIEKLLGSENDKVIVAKGTLAGAYFSTEDYDGAVSMWTDIAAYRARKTGYGFRWIGIETDIGRARRYQGRDQEAERIFRQTLDKAKESFTESEPKIQILRYNLAATILDQGRTDEAADLLDGLSAEALDDAEAEPDWDGRLIFAHGILALLNKNYAVALPLLKQAQTIIPVKHPDGFITNKMIQDQIDKCEAGLRGKPSSAEGINRP